MNMELFLPPLTIAEIFSKTRHDGQITPIERQSLKSALLEDRMEEEEHEAIDRLLYAVKRGWLRIID